MKTWIIKIIYLASNVYEIKGTKIHAKIKLEKDLLKVSSYCIGHTCHDKYTTLTDTEIGSFEEYATLRNKQTKRKQNFWQYDIF